MQQELNDFCDRWLSAWTGNRPDELIEYYTKDTYYSDPAMPNGLIGHGAVFAYFTKLLKRNPSWTWTRSELYPNDNGFTLKWKALIPSNHGSVECQGMDLVVLQDGKIVRNEVYFDPTAIAKGSSPVTKATVPTRMEFWFDFGSTYSYLTAMRIERVCPQRGIDVVWRPFLLGAIFKEQGFSTSPFVLYPEEGNYMWKEMERRSRAYSLSRYKKPSTFPRNGLLPSRIALAAADESWVGQFIGAVFRANFEQDQDISNQNIVSAILRELGLDAAQWIERANQPEIKNTLREQTDRARKIGIFGAPTFSIENESFWGDDRLEEACSFAVLKSSKK